MSPMRAPSVTAGERRDARAVWAAPRACAPWGLRASRALLLLLLLLEWAGTHSPVAEYFVRAEGLKVVDVLEDASICHEGARHYEAHMRRHEIPDDVAIACVRGHV